MNYTFDFAPVLEGMPDLLWGCAGTLGLALSGMLLALVIGIGGVVLRDSHRPALRWLEMAGVGMPTRKATGCRSRHSI